jgi:hypothetical protein
VLDLNSDHLSEHRGALGWPISVCKLDPNFRVREVIAHYQQGQNIASQCTC